MRGGQRAGAGRPRTLEYWERVWIGSQCERLRSEAVQASLAERVERKHQGTEIEELQKEFDSLPKHLRSSMVEAANRGPENAVNERIQEAAFALQYRRAALEQRGRYVRGKQPYGYRERVAQQVATLATSRFGKVVTPRLVKECWAEYSKQFRTDD
jgi:hypothetical protein